MSIADDFIKYIETHKCASRLKEQFGSNDSRTKIAYEDVFKKKTKLLKEIRDLENDIE